MYLDKKRASITNPYLLIGGAPKSGTTSLFRYLSEHPEICPSNRKETYFFAREFDYNKVCTFGDTLTEFEQYFTHCRSKSNIRIEATPYTLYAKDGINKIASILVDASFLFILRDPLDRLLSDYKFHKQRNHPSTRGTFKYFINWQYSMEGSIPNLIDLGCYVKFLRPFLDKFGRTNIHIMFFEELIANPLAQIKNLSKLIGIDSSFYNTYNFEIHNPTLSYKYSWMNNLYMNMEPIIANMRVLTMNFPFILKVFEKALSKGKTIYRSINRSRNNNGEIFPKDILEELRSYYRPFNDALSKLINLPLPW